MTQWHTRTETKASGGVRYAKNRCTKKKAWIGGNFTATKIAEEGEKGKVHIVAGRGKTAKAKQKIAKYANVTDKKSGKTSKTKISEVLENAADRHFVRRNIITKGAIISVEAEGKEKKAKVTSRPGQSGITEAVLLE